VDSTIPRTKRHGNAVHCVMPGRYLLPPSEPASPYVFANYLFWSMALEQRSSLGQLALVEAKWFWAQ